jgi:oxygen-independent coproporphyrinogen-3 oxidase
LAGIYLHIPFCKSRCIYCDFYSQTDETPIDKFTEAVCREVRLRKQMLANETVRTVYFGGGTPSRLQQKHLEKIFDTLYAEFSMDNLVEVTLEANPDDLSPAYIGMLRRLPFNRISIGIQSFNDNELKFLGRRHASQDAVRAVKDCQQMGFDNISIDLMYGLPNQTLEIWQSNLQRACSLGVQHISAYHLTYEENTPLYGLLQKGKIHPIDEERSSTFFTRLIDTLAEGGFIHYEISNFAKPGYFSRHNSSYWEGDKYLGLGPSAHSFDGNKRSWNTASLTDYLDGIFSGNLPCETEYLSLYQHYNEFILTRLRTREGIDTLELKERFGESLYRYCLKGAQKFIAENLLNFQNNILKLTRKGIFISDGIISELMQVDTNE